MLLGMERLEENGGMDVHHVCARLREDVDDGSRALVVEPPEQPPLPTLFCAKPFLPLVRPGAEGDDEEPAVVHWLDRKEISILHEDLLRHLVHRS